MTDPEQMNPFTDPGATPAVGYWTVCGYGCGRRFYCNPGSRLRGHGACLTELAADLWALAKRFPAVTMPRLAADLGISLNVLTSILAAARSPTASKRLELDRAATHPYQPPKGALTVRDRATLTAVAHHVRRERVIPSESELAEDLGCTKSAAANRLRSLRRKGWISYSELLHVVRCGDVGCRWNTCPSRIRLARKRSRAAVAVAA